MPLPADLPEPPVAARTYLADRLASLERYAAVLAGPGVERGLLGPREVPRLWERHLLNCAVLNELVPSGASLADVGSGAGLPGIVMALMRPDLDVTLVEPMLRRVRFLEECADVLDLQPRVRIVRDRAENLAGVVSADVVTARAVAPLEKLVRWCLPLVVPGGQLLALKGSGVAEEVSRARPALRRGGAGEVEVLDVGSGVVERLATVVRVRMPQEGNRRRGGDR